jgi:hypothetical protein
MSLMNSDKPIPLPGPSTEPARSPTTLPLEVQNAAASRLSREQELLEEQRAAHAEHALEAREVRAIDADTEARRAQATSAIVRGAAITGGIGLAGLALGGPLGAVVGVGVGWLADHMIGDR